MELKTQPISLARDGSERAVVEAFNATLAALRARRPDVRMITFARLSRSGWGILSLDGRPACEGASPAAAMAAYLRVQ